jgi:hypothetical protein
LRSGEGIGAIDVIVDGAQLRTPGPVFRYRCSRALPLVGAAHDVGVRPRGDGECSAACVACRRNCWFKDDAIVDCKNGDAPIGARTPLQLTLERSVVEHDEDDDDDSVL